MFIHIGILSSIIWILTNVVAAIRAQLNQPQTSKESGHNAEESNLSVWQLLSDTRFNVGISLNLEGPIQSEKVILYALMAMLSARAITLGI